MNQIDVTCITDIAREAGAAILEIYRRDFAVEAKDDRSPLTEADRAAHTTICRRLAERYPNIPLLSEEGEAVDFATRHNWPRFWLVDPLDGTKEFIKRNGEFTVNIALVEGGSPALGVIYAPALDRLYWGEMGSGAWVQVGCAPAQRLHPRAAPPAEGLTVVKSRSHPSAELEAYLATLPVAAAIEVGSSLKLCAVAEGRADLYARFGPTMEWDTAAGQAIVEAAGGRVVDPAGTPLRYNKPDLHNGHFIVRA